MRQPPAAARGGVARWGVRGNAEVVASGPAACVADLDDHPIGMRLDHDTYRWRTVLVRVGNDLADGEDQPVGVARVQPHALDQVGDGSASFRGRRVVEFDRLVGSVIRSNSGHRTP